MDRKQSILSEHEDDHLDEIPGPTWAEHNKLRRIRLRIEVGDDKRVIVGMRMSSSPTRDAGPRGGCPHAHSVIRYPCPRKAGDSAPW